MRFSTSLLVASILAGPALAQTTVSVPATTTVYPGTPGGSTSPIVVALNGATSLTFSTTGSITFNASDYNSPDGIGSVSGTNIAASGGVSGISAPYAGYLVGVFETAAGPDPLTTPASLAYTASDLQQGSYAPVLNQAFFIGDGLTALNATGASAGAVQTFFVPTGATSLILGFADAPGYSGSPGSYGDNFGSMTVTVNGLVAAVPEPASWAMMVMGFGLLGTALRHRRTIAFA